MHASEAVYRALYGRLTGATDAGARVYAEFVPEGVARPYLIYRVVAGVQRGFFLRKLDPSMVCDVKAVAQTRAEAATIANQAIYLLDSAGEQEAGGMDGGADWHLLVTRAEGDIYQTYTVGLERVYEVGFQLRIIMEAKDG